MELSTVRFPHRLDCVVSMTREAEDGMYVDPIYDGEICPSCGEVPLTGDPGDDVECPSCGAVFYIPEDDE